MIYIENFKFAHTLPDTVAQLRNDINWTTSELDAQDAQDAPLSDDRREALERRLAGLHEAHVTLQIRDAYLQVITRANGWKNPWEEPDFSGFEGVTDEDLLEFLRQHQINNKTKRDKKRETLAARRRIAKASVIWHRPENLTDRYRAIDGRLHEVREQRRADGETVRDVSPYPVNSTRIKYKGEMISAAIVIKILTGTAARRGRPPKGQRFKAQVRQGSRVVHLGMFDTAHERDAAVLNHRLGLGVNPAPNIRG